MVRHRRIAPLALALCCLLGGLPSCSEKPATTPAPARDTPAVSASAAAAPSIYDAKGRLKPSKERVEWLEIPMGFERRKQGYERHVLFDARGVPLDKARDFFATRMFTGKVEESATGLFFAAVMPISADQRAVRLNVQLSFRSFDNSLTLDIERLTYDGAKPLTDQEARKALANERARAE